ncbi:helix-turn-helix domain-containing protein [Lichenifustis flavocetrariae]|uniref:Transcriptional regulator n=1 Tax=Lichenifustis flavocetrariae TaxID=2949735 RepID=A0AA41Z173_9HYPH|nr:helix-turn-helix domain-containing protein [Lichenifustis flavocetrariae]MCW6510965.1 transcriptional regulator [Lichenifustis flavocetrariae]
MEFSVSMRAGGRQTPFDAGMSGNERIVTPVRRRPGAEVDAREIRTKLGMSQPAFANAFGLKLATLRDWEQGRNKPEGATRVLLMTIAHRPDIVREAVAAYG